MSLECLLLLNGLSTKARRKLVRHLAMGVCEANCVGLLQAVLFLDLAFVNLVALNLIVREKSSLLAVGGIRNSLCGVKNNKLGFLLH